MTHCNALFTCVPHMQISGRSSGSSKGDAKEAATYARLMDKVGDALMAAAAAAMEPGTAPELDFEGSLEEYGKRLCSAMVSFGEHHFGMLNGLQKQYTFLQHVSEPYSCCTGHTALVRAQCMCGSWLCCYPTGHA